MAELMVPKPFTANLPVFFNVQGVVGAPPASNGREDVLLVQYAFKVIADTPRTASASLIAAARAVRVTGTIDEATINAIREFQKECGGGR